MALPPPPAAPKSPPPLFHGCCNRIFSGITPISQPEMRPGEEGLAAGSVIIGVRNAALIPCVICRKSETKFTTLITKMSKSTYEGGAARWAAKLWSIYVDCLEMSEARLFSVSQASQPARCTLRSARAASLHCMNAEK